MKKNFITVNWSASEMNPWTSEIEVIAACGTGIICKPNDSRLMTNDFGNVFIPVEKTRFNDNYGYVIGRAFEMIAYVEYSEIEDFIKENGYKVIQLDMHDVIVTDRFDKNTKIKDAYYKSNDIGYMINRYDDDLTDNLANMTIGQLKKKMCGSRAMRDKFYKEEFYKMDTAVRPWVMFLIHTINKD